MIARPAGSKLSPCQILESARNRVFSESRISHCGVAARRIPVCAWPKVRVVLNCAAEFIALLLKDVRRGVENGHAHPAGNIDPHRIRNDRILRCQYATNWQPIAL